MQADVDAELLGARARSSPRRCGWDRNGGPSRSPRARSCARAPGSPAGGSRIPAAFPSTSYWATRELADVAHVRQRAHLVPVHAGDVRQGPDVGIVTARGQPVDRGLRRDARPRRPRSPHPSPARSATRRARASARVCVRRCGPTSTRPAHSDPRRHEARPARAAAPGPPGVTTPARIAAMDRPFEGVIGDDWRTSTPWWEPDPEPPDGAPNVLLIVLDDVGFAQLGCYGSDISTPALDGLAARGVRLTNFHTTALCSPTRSCLLTGRNHHRNGMARVADLAIGLSRLLRPHPARERLPLRDPARARLRDVRGRQVAPHARRRHEHGRLTRELAARAGLRPLVRVPRRRDAPVRAVPVPRQPLRAAARAARGRLPPERRPRRPRDRVPRRPARGRRRAAVLLLLRDRRVPLAAPRAARVDRALPRATSTWVGTRGATRRSRASRRAACSPTAPR